MSGGQFSDRLVYHYDPDPESADWPVLLKEGAANGWLVIHRGVGPAQAVPAVAVTDGDGYGFIEPTGEWQDVTIADQREAGGE